MTTGRIIITITGIIVGIILIAFTINILQKGGTYKGQTMGEILDKSPEKASAGDLLELSKQDFMQLFYASPPPEMSDLNGEYRAVNHTGGILSRSVQLYTDHFFGKGKWIGKAFRLNNGKGEGYNIFEQEGKIHRMRKIDTSIGTSAFDKKDSFLLNYGAYNSGLVNSMRDELRKINDNLYIGLGYMGIGGGSINPSGFLVFDKQKEWVGADE